LRVRIDIAFYRDDVDSWQEALQEVEDGISADLARDYDFIDHEVMD